MLARGERERLPNCRNSPSVRPRIGEAQSSIYVRAGEFRDGRLGEIFVTASKRGLMVIDAAASLDAFAIAVSIGLQYGVPLETLVDRFVGTRSEPNGVVTGHGRIKMASSVHDLIFRHLGIDYLDRDDLANIS